MCTIFKNKNENVALIIIIVKDYLNSNNNWEKNRFIFCRFLTVHTRVDNDVLGKS